MHRILNAYCYNHCPVVQDNSSAPNMALLHTEQNFLQEFCTLSFVFWFLAQNDVPFLHLNRYSVEASSMEHSCSCCKEVETSMKEVELQCPSGESITHKYVYVESCGCQDTQCVVSESSESQSTEENDEKSRNHRRRAISLTWKWSRKKLTALK